MNVMMEGLAAHTSSNRKPQRPKVAQHLNPPTNDPYSMIPITPIQLGSRCTVQEERRRMPALVLKMSLKSNVLLLKSKRAGGHLQQQLEGAKVRRAREEDGFLRALI
jgi:hypothetical protein